MTNKKLKETADYFLYDCGFLDELKKYGTPHIIGSYRMNTMAWNDLDIDVENENMSTEKLYRLTDYILKRFKPTWYESKQETNEKGEIVWFHGFETVITGELWNFDIWFFSKSEIEAVEKYCDSIAHNTTLNQKDTIIEIKKQLIARDLYSFEKFKSTDVYNAVVNDNIITIDEFLKVYKR